MFKIIFKVLLLNIIFFMNAEGHSRQSFVPYYQKFDLTELNRLGQGTGNGGDVVVCEDGSNIKSYELLDLYEATYLHNVDFEKPRERTAVEHALHHIKKIPGWKSTQYYEIRIKNILDRVIFVNDELPDVSDSLHTYLPKNCHLEQVAINKLNGVIEVNRGIWEQLTDRHKGALILHELFYEDMILSGHNNSIFARKLNSLIHGREYVLRREFEKSEQSINQGIALEVVKESKVILDHPILIYKTTPFKEVKALLLENIFENGYHAEFENLLIQDIDAFLLQNFGNDVHIDSLITTLKNMTPEGLAEYGLLKQFLIDKIKSNNTDPKISKLIELLHVYQQSKLINYESFRDLVLTPMIFSWEACEQLKKVCVTLVEEMPNYDQEVVRFVMEESRRFDEYDDETHFYVKLIKSLSLNFKLDINTLDEIYKRIRSSFAPRTSQLEYIKILHIQEYSREKIVNKIEDFIDDIDLYGESTKLFYNTVTSLNDSVLYRELERSFIDKLRKSPFIQDPVIEMFLHYYRKNVVPDALAIRMMEIFKTKGYEPNLSAILFNLPYDFIMLCLDQSVAQSSVLNYLGYELRFGNQDVKLVVLSLLKKVPSFNQFLYSAIYQEMRRSYRQVSLLKKLLLILKKRTLTEEIIDYIIFLQSHDDPEIARLARELLSKK